MKKNVLAPCVLLLSVIVLGFSACDSTLQQPEIYDIVATVFPAYDFARAVAGDALKIKMLISPGSEAHGYTPTLDELAEVQNCKLFIYTGGSTDAWADEQFASGSIDTSQFTSIAMTDCVALLPIAGNTEEHTSAEERIHGSDFDEHVWTSPENAVLLVTQICSTLCEIYPDKEDIFTANRDSYIARIREQENAMWEIVNNADNKLLVFENRFPFAYFCEYFGLSHLAAFGSCASNTEVPAATLDTLVTTINEQNIPCILYLEFSRMETAQQIAAATGCAKMELHSYHNVTREDFENSVTYIDLMKRNTATLKEALS